MESVLMDTSPHNPGSVDVGNNRLYSSSSLYSSCLSHLHGGTRPPPPSPYYTLPSVYSSSPFFVPPRPLRQPPLLPLPFPNPTSVSSSNKEVSMITTSRSRVQQKKGSSSRRSRSSGYPPSGLPKQQAAVASTTVKPDASPVVHGDDHVDEGGRVVFTGFGCFISPPPSSLPLPRFSLVRPKASHGGS